MNEERKEAAILMARAVGTFQARKNRRVWAIGKVGIPENIQEAHCEQKEGSFLRSRVWTENSWLGGGRA